MIPTKYCCNIQSLQFLLYCNKIISNRSRRKVPERPPCLYGTHKFNNVKSTPHHLWVFFYELLCFHFVLWYQGSKQCTRIYFSVISVSFFILYCLLSWFVTIAFNSLFKNHKYWCKKTSNCCKVSVNTNIAAMDIADTH